MNPFPTVNRLLFVTIPGPQAEALMQSLNRAQYYFTQINNNGGLLFPEESVCIMIGLHNTRTGSLMGLIAETCKPHPEHLSVRVNPPVGFPPLPVMGTPVGSALVYSMDVEQFQQF
jgi:uncharacterized protein YaaQ